MDAKVFDGPAIFFIKSRKTPADDWFLQFCKEQLKTTKRIDIVWDVYRKESLKEYCRQQRRACKENVGDDTEANIVAEYHKMSSDTQKSFFRELAKKVENHRFSVNEEVNITFGKQDYIITSFINYHDY